MPGLPQFDPQGRPGEAAEAFSSGMNDAQSWMNQAQNRAAQKQQMEEAHQRFEFQKPVLQAKAAADLIGANNDRDEMVGMQKNRIAASNLMLPAQQAFGNILKINDIKQRAEAGLQWVNEYGQLANVKEYSAQFNDQKEIVAKMFQDYKTHELLANQLKIQSQKSQTPLVRNAQAYADAVGAGDQEMAAMIKMRMDKDAALFTPSDKNEYLMLTHALTNLPPGVDPSVITARLEQLSGRTINTVAPGASGQPSATPAPAQPGAALPAPSGGSPAPGQAATAQPVIATAGAPRITPANKTKAQEDLFKLQGLVHQGVDVLNSLDGHPEYLGVRGQAGSVIADSLLPALGVGSGDQGRVSARQKIGIFRDSLLKTIADLPRVSQAEISDIKSNLPDTGWGSNLAADTTKLRNVLELLGRKAQEEAKRLGVSAQPAQ